MPNFWKWSLYPPPRCNIVNTRSCQSLIFSKSTLFVRIILACLHFIENVQRQKKNKTKEGKKYIHINFPKFSLGSEVVQQVAVDPGGDSLLLGEGVQTLFGFGKIVWYNFGYAILCILRIFLRVAFEKIWQGGCKVEYFSKILKCSRKKLLTIPLDYVAKWVCFWGLKISWI